jgi:hypothetical protein
VADDEALRFGERLLALLDATRYSATYKLATPLALIHVTTEQTTPDGTTPVILPAKEVNRRVIELYWPQTIPCGAAAEEAEPGCCPRRRKTTFPPRWPPGGPPATSWDINHRHNRDESVRSSCRSGRCRSAETTCPARHDLIPARQKQGGHQNAVHRWSSPVRSDRILIWSSRRAAVSEWPLRRSALVVDSSRISRKIGYRSPSRSRRVSRRIAASSLRSRNAIALSQRSAAVSATAPVWHATLGAGRTAGGWSG